MSRSPKNGPSSQVEVKAFETPTRHVPLLLWIMLVGARGRWPAVAEATIWFSRTRSATHGEMTPIRIATETAILSQVFSFAQFPLLEKCRFSRKCEAEAQQCCAKAMKVLDGISVFLQNFDATTRLEYFILETSIAEQAGVILKLLGFMHRGVLFWL